MVRRSALLVGSALTVLGCSSDGPGSSDPSDPSGASGATGGDLGRFEGHPTCDVTSPPPEVDLDALYTRYLNCSGIAVVATDGVDDQALLVADETIEFMLVGNEAYREQMIASGQYYILRGDDVTIADLPEPFVYLDENQGASDELLRASTSRGNQLLCKPGDPHFFGSNLFVHEFAHQIHFAGIGLTSAGGDQIRATYDAVRAAGLWDNTYAGSNYIEYFAELTEEWFEVGRPRGPVDGDGFSNHVYSRAELLAYDPDGHALVASYFQAGFDVPGCIQRNVVHPWVDPELACEGSVVDADGNSYPVARIGNQCWMASNLATTTLLDGTQIPEVGDALAWSSSATPARCTYEDDPAQVASLGRLYNQPAVLAPGLCPEGMRVPTIDDVIELVQSTGMGDGTIAVANLRAVGAWGEAPATDQYDFAARPTGTRDGSGAYAGLGSQWLMWTTSDDPSDAVRGAAYAIFANLEDVQLRGEARAVGASVRCVAG